MMRSLGVVAAVVLLAALCSGESGCKKDLHCELIMCGIPLCPPGYSLKMEECACCPGCVLNSGEDSSSIEQGLVRRRRQLRKSRVGTAQLKSKMHQHFAQGSSIPEKYRKIMDKRDMDSARQLSNGP
ncbi:hypothetical protein GWK47_028018 [Chionoecetes opilio]|uniref:Uncharacterized protein n=1 Tax=Chionoecetes opilio TaxID=41210 RepID=A0A8J5D5W5_CHIOP|nr:hypothetical protein GWK47_028018 [Chionoecetes opilio]